MINYGGAFLHLDECVILNEEPISENMIGVTHRILVAGMQIDDDLIPGQ